jgi:hypothetical protein
LASLMKFLDPSRITISQLDKCIEGKSKTAQHHWRIDSFP